MNLVMLQVKHKLFYVVTLFMLCIGMPAKAQQIVQVSGVVADSKTGETLPAATIMLEPTSLGIWVLADNDGRYNIKTVAKATGIQFSYVGYNTVSVPFVKGKIPAQLDVKLKAEDNILEEVVVKAKRIRYRNKDNPAVELIRKVIDNKGNNRLEAHDFYEYVKYEKIELSLNDLNDSIKSSAAFRNFPFLNKYLDTLPTGETRLPFFLRENLSECFYRKSPEAKKEFLLASKMADFNDFIETATLGAFIDGMVSKANLYDNTIMILDNQYQSPISPLGPGFYQYHIIDTTFVSGVQCINLAVYPRNDADFGFAGNLYITNDSTYALKRAELRLTKNANINFVRGLSLVQEYMLVDNSWCLMIDEATIDFTITGKKSAMLGKRTNSYHNYTFDKRIPDSKFKGENQEKVPGYDMRAPEFWQEERPLALNKTEQGIYDMVTEMRQDKKFNRIMGIAGLVFSGMINVGDVDLGPVETFFSFNSIEGARFRIGGKTNARFNPHLFFDGFVAYGTKDEKFKYHAGAMYSFTRRKLHPWEYPMNLLSVSYEYNTETPGQFFLFGSGDRLLLSFHRGDAPRMLYSRNFDVKYDREMAYGWSIHPSLTFKEEEPAGELKFENAYGPVENLTATQLNLKVRFAPKERFYQVQQNRFPLNHTNPVFTASYNYGIKNLWGSDYDFHRLEVGLDKRTWFSSLGFFDMWLKAGKIWNTVPFPLLVIHQANQNYAYQDEAFNMMNYLEFVSDQYASANLSYCFNGWIFNRVPLIKKLKWREYFTFKALWGSVADHNLPQNNPDLLKFPTDENGNPTTFALGDRPYMEASFAIDNIFKVLRIDLVKRINYLDHPDVPEWSVRFRLRFVF